MRTTHTHTYAVLQVRPETYADIRQRLAQAKYDDAFHSDSQHKEVIDMHGIALAVEKKLSRPRIITLVGSSRFCDIAAVKAWELEKQGNIVFNMHLLPAWYQGVKPSHQAEEEKVADILDNIHLRKIDLSDEVLVINAYGYIGKRTQVEIDYADSLGKPVLFMEEGLNHCDESKIETNKQARKVFTASSQ